MTLTEKVCVAELEINNFIGGAKLPFSGRDTWLSPSASREGGRGGRRRAVRILVLLPRLGLQVDAGRRAVRAYVGSLLQSVLAVLDR